MLCIGAAAGSVSATRMSSGILSAMEAIRVLGGGEVSVFYPIPDIFVRKIPNNNPPAGLHLPAGHWPRAARGHGAASK
jgi:hypothetical protein